MSENGTEVKIQLNGKDTKLQEATEQEQLS